MPEEGQNLVDLVEAQRFFTLLQIADETKSHSGAIGEVMLRQVQRSTFIFQKLNQRIIHLEYPIGYKKLIAVFTIPDRVYQGEKREKYT